METRAVVADRQRATLQLDLDGPTVGAPLARVVEHVGDRAGDPVALAADERRLDRRLDPHLRRPAPRALDDARDDLIDPPIAHRPARPPAARELDHVTDERRQLV